MSPSATSDQLSDRDYYFFRVNASTLDNATRIAQHHLKQQPIHRFAAAYDLSNQSYTCLLYTSRCV